MGIKVTRLAYGVPVGSQLEYADEVTLSRALGRRQEMANDKPQVFADLGLCKKVDLGNLLLFDGLRYVGSIPFFAFLYVIKTQPAALQTLKGKRVFANGTVTVEEEKAGIISLPLWSK